MRARERFWRRLFTSLKARKIRNWVVIRRTKAAFAAGSGPAIMAPSVGQSWDPTAFATIPPYRPKSTAYRLVFVGALSPLLGAADFQSAASRWAKHHPMREIDITWVGEGDLRSVLDAQPLPPNMRQRFAGVLSGAALAAVFAESGLLVVPDIVGRDDAPLFQAAAAGLPVLGSHRNRTLKATILPGETGWLFDPLAPGARFEVLVDAMATGVGRLNEMRVASKARALVPLAQCQSLDQSLATS